jgi:hypothetical protein
MLQFSITHKEVRHDLSMDHEEAVSVGAVEREDVAEAIRIGEVVEEGEVDGTDMMGTETETEIEIVMIVDHQEVLVVIEIGTAIVVDVGSCTLACRCIIIVSMLEYAMSVLFQLGFVCRLSNLHFSHLVSL